MKKENNFAFHPPGRRRRRDVSHLGRIHADAVQRLRSGESGPESRTLESLDMRLWISFSLCVSLWIGVYLWASLCESLRLSFSLCLCLWVSLCESLSLSLLLWVFESESLCGSEESPSQKRKAPLSVSHHLTSRVVFAGTRVRAVAVLPQRGVQVQPECQPRRPLASQGSRTRECRIFRNFEVFESVFVLYNFLWWRWNYH